MQTAARDVRFCGPPDNPKCGRDVKVCGPKWQAYQVDLKMTDLQKILKKDLLMQNSQNLVQILLQEY